MLQRTGLFLTIVLLLAACGPSQAVQATWSAETEAAQAARLTETQAARPTSTPTETLTPQPTATSTRSADFFTLSCVDEEDLDLPAYIDILRVDAEYEAGNLLISFALRELPEQLAFNQGHVAGLYQEYAWSIDVDTDANPQTGGWRGGEVWITARYLADSNQAAFLGAIEENVEVVIFRYEPASDTYVDRQLFRQFTEVDLASSTISFSARVPGLTSKNIVNLEAFSYPDSDNCLIP